MRPHYFGASPDNSNIIDALLVDYLEQEPHLHNVLMFFDLPFLIRLMDKRLNPAEFKDCYFVNKYEKLLSGRGKDTSNSLKRIKRRFNTETYKIYKTLVLDEKRFQGRYDDYEMLQQEKLVYLWRLFPVASVSAFQSLYRHLQVICTFKFRHQYSIANGLGLVLVNAINNEFNTGLSILRFYLQEGNIAYLNSYPIFLATYRQNKDCVTQLYQFIVEIDFQNRQTWLENYFYWLPEDLVTADSA